MKDRYKKEMDVLTLDELQTATIKLIDILDRNPNILDNCLGFDYTCNEKLIVTICNEGDIKEWRCLNPIVMNMPI